MNEENNMSPVVEPFSYKKAVKAFNVRSRECSLSMHDSRGILPSTGCAG